MAQTKLMRADEIANAFNSVTERQYWKAAIGGTRLNPEVHFNSRSSMVRVSYRIATEDFAVTFSRTSAAFGDFMASAYRSLEQVLTSLKAAGLPFCTVIGDIAVLRLEYDPRGKGTLIHMAGFGDNWPQAEPLPFKVPERNNSESAFLGIDPL